ncbi:MAG: hypothetical protein KAS86_01950 [Candidatus Omnitrophica bacterium]|nr:hypothetical protein [Candidatus Omnitrophota bacterium]
MIISFEDFQKLDIRVAEIIAARELPGADKLYVLTISVGEKNKQIVAGIRSSYGIDELKGKKIIVIDNLEPAVIRGEESSGMLLAVCSESGPVLLVPDREVTPGSKVS